MIAPWILASLAFLVLFWQPLSTMVRDWFHNADAGHGLLLAPLTIYLAWPAEAAEAAVDTTHPLAYGYDERVTFSATTARFWSPRVSRAPDFRAFWYGTNGLLVNAVVFGGVF